MLKVSTHCTFYDIHMPFSKQKRGGSTDQRIYFKTPEKGLSVTKVSKIHDSFAPTCPTIKQSVVLRCAAACALDAKQQEG